MGVSEEFLAYVLDQYTAWGGVVFRRMFGGAGLYRDGKMFGLVSDDVVYLKVDDSNRNRFEEAGCTPFKPYADRPATMSYYEVPARVLENPVALVEWSAVSLAIQRGSGRRRKGQSGRGRKKRG